MPPLSPQPWAKDLGLNFIQHHAMQMISPLSKDYHNENQTIPGVSYIFPFHQHEGKQGENSSIPKCHFWPKADYIEADPFPIPRDIHV